MEIKFNISDLIDIINEEVDRLAARSYSEDGGSMFDGIKITSRDARVQERIFEERDARLRSFLTFCLGETEREEDETTGETYLIYNIKEQGMKLPSLSSVRVLLRKYLVDSVLYDWYTKHNIPSTITIDDIEALESKIVCTLRQGYTKKPLQPFGPRK